MSCAAVWLAVAIVTPARPATRAPGASRDAPAHPGDASPWAVPPDAPDWSATTLDGRRLHLLEVAKKKQG